MTSTILMRQCARIAATTALRVAVRWGAPGERPRARAFTRITVTPDGGLDADVVLSDRHTSRSCWRTWRSSPRGRAARARSAIRWGADRNAVSDVYLLDRQTGRMRCLSREAVEEWWAPSLAPAIDARGSSIAFSSPHSGREDAIHLGFTVFVHRSL